MSTADAGTRPGGPAWAGTARDSGLGVAAQTARGTRRAGTDGTALPAKRSALQPLPGAGVASGAAGLVSTRRAGALSSAQGERVGRGRLPVFSKKLRHLGLNF